MSSSVVRVSDRRIRAREPEKPADTEFVADLLAAYDREQVNERKAMLAVRIVQLLLKGVNFERLEMKRSTAITKNK